MAHFLQRVVISLLIAGIAGAQERPFSHRLHLELKLQCATCHTAAASSTKAGDNLLPPAVACVKCHTDGRAIKAPAKRQVDKFNHQLHSKFGNIAPMLRAAISGKTYLSPKPPGHLETRNNCAGCHHGIEQSDNVQTASVFPHMADCLVCHNKIDPPFTCEKCHNAPAKLKPANHTPDFMDRHNRMKDTLDRSGCAVCHGREFHCLGCH